MNKVVIILVLVLISLIAIGAQVKISELPTRATAYGTDYVPIIDQLVGGTTSKVMVSNFFGSNVVTPNYFDHKVTLNGGVGILALVATPGATQSTQTFAVNGNNLVAIGVVRNTLAQGDFTAIFQTVSGNMRFSTDGFVSSPLTIASNGKVGINTTTPSQSFVVIGDVYISGKVSAIGGIDPPYMLFDQSTRVKVADQVEDEVDTGKRGGAVMFFNDDTKLMEIYLPSKGDFYSITGTKLASIPKRTSETKEYGNRRHGEASSFIAPAKPKFKNEE